MVTLFGNRNKPRHDSRSMHRRVNEWCNAHKTEVREIRTFVAMELAGKRRPSSRLIEEAVDERGIFLPFSSRELVKYSGVNFFG